MAVLWYRQIAIWNWFETADVFNLRQTSIVVIVMELRLLMNSPIFNYSCCAFHWSNFTSLTLYCPGQQKKKKRTIFITKRLIKKKAFLFRNQDSVLVYTEAESFAKHRVLPISKETSNKYFCISVSSCFSKKKKLILYCSLEQHTSRALRNVRLALYTQMFISSWLSSRLCENKKSGQYLL